MSRMRISSKYTVKKVCCICGKVKWFVDNFEKPADRYICCNNCAKIYLGGKKQKKS